MCEPSDARQASVEKPICSTPSFAKIGTWETKLLAPSLEYILHLIPHHLANPHKLWRSGANASSGGLRLFVRLCASCSLLSLSALAHHLSNSQYVWCCALRLTNTWERTTSSVSKARSYISVPPHE